MVFSPVNLSQAGQDTLFIQAAIDSKLGLVGYQMYQKMPTSTEVVGFIQKVKAKVEKGSTKEKDSVPKWIIMNENEASRPRCVSAAAAKAGFRLVQFPNEETNQRFNNARGLWPYLA